MVKSHQILTVVPGKYRRLIIGLLLLCCAMAPFLLQAQNATVRAVNTPSKDLFGIQNVFVENAGQYGDTLAGYGHMGRILWAYEGLGMPVLLTEKGWIHLQRKLKRGKERDKDEAERERERKQGKHENEAEEDWEHPQWIDKVITLQWKGANEKPAIRFERAGAAYHTYASISRKAMSAGKVIYEELYPGIDLVFSFPEKSAFGFEYSLVVRPHADLSRVQLLAGGDLLDQNPLKAGKIILQSSIGEVSFSSPVAYYGSQVLSKPSGTRLPVSFHYAATGKTIGFKLPAGTDRRQTLIIDPFVTGTGNLTGLHAGKAKDVDFDYAGNVYVTGGGDASIHKLAKYDAAGNLLWTFSGALTIPAWNFGTYWGGWMVEKPSGNIYLGQGFNPSTGFQVIRVTTTGLYDNYITIANPNFKEAWKMLWSCNSGSPQILVAGGGTSSNINFGVFTPPATTIGSLNVTGIPFTGSAGWAQDIVDFVIDPSNNDMYTLYGSLIGHPSLNNKMYKNTFPYSGASVVWNTPSGYTTVQEVANRPYLPGGQIDNSANIFAINASYLYYWDGKNLKAFNKTTGATAGTPLVTANTALMQGGIIADACNNIFVGEGNGVIKVYTFNGSVFNDADAPDITIPGFAGKAVYDLAYDESKKLIYASGDGFVGSFDVSAYCPGSQYTLTATPDCLTSSATISVSPAPPAGSTLSYVLYNGTTVLATNTTGVFTGLQPGISYTVVATINQACSGTQATVSFTLPGPQITVSATATTCGNSSGSITASGLGSAAPYTYSIDGTNFQPTGNFTGLAAGLYTVTVKDANGCSTVKQITVLNSNGPLISYSSTNADCSLNNGTITVSVTGGNAPYQYSLNNGAYQSNPFFTGLIGGVYTLTVKDANGCTNAVQVTITSSSQPTLNAVPATATCGNSNGSITAFGSAGTAPLKYSINGNLFQPGGNFTNLAPGSYTVTVRDANGCTATTTVTVPNNPAPNVSGTTTAASCSNSNGTITASGSGGIAPLEYSLNGTTFSTSGFFSGLTPGTYTITVRDATGCSNITTVTVGTVGGPSVTATSTVSACSSNTGSITANGSGGTAPYQYSINGTTFQVSTVFNGLAPGNYIVYIRDLNGCISTIPVNVGSLAGPLLSVSVTPTACGANTGSITANGSGGTAPLLYSIDGVNYVPTNLFNGLGTGVYTVYVKDANNCIRYSTVTLTNVSNLSLSVNTLFSSCSSASGTITATATGGTAPLTYSIDGVNFVASPVFTGLAAGTYPVSVKDANGCIVTKNATIQLVAGPTLTISSTGTTCGGTNGVIIARGNGGVAPLTYSIDGGAYQANGIFINLPAGLHTITVKDATGCTSSQNITLTNSGSGVIPTDVTFRVRDALPCTGQTGRIKNLKGEPSGGGMKYEFSLDLGPFTTANQFLNVSPGVHTITARNEDGCTVTRIATIGIGTPATVSATVTAAACNTPNGTITVSGIGTNAPYHVSIDNGTTWITFAPPGANSYTFTGLIPGTYTLLVADDADFTAGPPDIPGACITTVYVVVPTSNGPTVSINQTNGTCNFPNGSITATGSGGVGPYTYNINGGPYFASGTFNNLAPGTYAIGILDASGCSGGANVTLTSAPIPQVTATVLPTSCNLNNGSITVTGSGGVAPLEYSINGTSFQSSPVFNNLAAGTYTVYVKDAGGCYSTVSATVSSSTVPRITAFTIAATCNNNDGSVVATGTGGQAPYTFSLNGTAYQNSNSFTGLAAGFYTLYLKDSRGCISTTGVTVSNLQAPLINTVLTNPANCNGASGSITITASGGTAPLEYSINGVSFQSATLFTSLLPGNYTVTVKDANGCIATRTVLVGNTNGPQTLSAVVLNAACGASNGSITAAASGGTLPLQYSINGTTYQASPLFTTLAAGTYTVYVKDATNCIKSIQAIVLNLPGPLVSASPSPASCGLNDGTITGTVSGGTGAISYSIDGINFQSSPVFLGLATGTYTLTAKDQRGCTHSTVAVVGVAGSSVTPSFAPVGPICSGSLLSPLPLTSTNGITGTWSPALNNTATTTYTFTPAAGQCATSTTLTITVNPNLTPTFNAVAAICSGQTLAALPTTSLNGITGTWSPALNNTATTTYTFTPAAGQCATSTTLTITVNPNITPTFNAVAAVCAGEVLTALPTTSLNGITGTWAPALNNTATTTYTFTPAAGQCATSTTLTITVNPNITPSFNAVAAICAGEALNALPLTSLNGITGTWAPALNNTATTTYTFTPAAGQCATSTTLTITVNPNITPSFNAVAAICAGEALTALPTTSLNGITGTWAPALNNTATTTYTFTPAAGQCATSTTLTITVNPNITPTFNGVAAICVGETLTALPNTSLNGITGTWAPALNNTATTTYTFTPAAGQCAISTTLTITVNPNITPTFNAVAAICAGEVLTALPTTSLNGITGTWSPALNNTATTTYTFTPAAGQCANSTTLTITVNPNITPAFNAVAAICSGQTLAALPTTSLNGITGTWAPALNNTATTTYTFTPTAGQCATSTTLTITVNPNITPTFNGVAAICAGETLAALPTTSLNGITGTWVPALNNTATTTYTFTPAAGQCAAPATLTITIYSVPSPPAVTLTQPNCTIPTGSATIVSPVTGFTYSLDGSGFAPYPGTGYSNLLPGSHTLIARSSEGCLSAATSFVITPAPVPPVSISMITTAAACGNNNGTLTLGAVTGGTAPFTYSVDGSAFTATLLYTGLAAGSHSVVVRDVNGCTLNTSAGVNSTNGATVTAVSSNSICGNNNGSITASGNGGQAPYLFSIDGVNYQSSPSFSGLAAGNYTLSIKDANNCVNTTSAVVGNTTGASITATSFNSTCGANNGSISATGTGGAGPYSFSIDGINYQPSGSFNNLPAGSYIVSIKDGNNCINNTTVIIGNTNGATVSATSTNSSCGSSNGSITATGNGGTAPYSFSIDGTNFQTSGSFNSLAAGSYTVSIKDANNCVNTISVVVGNTNGATVNATSTNASCGSSNGSITATGTGGTAPYSFSIDGVNFQASGNFIGIAAGSYTVSIKDANNCVNTISIVVGNTNGASVTATSTNASCGTSNGSITATGAGGTAPYSFSIDGINFQASGNFNGLASGSYTVSIKDANNCINTISIAVGNSNGATVAATSTNASCGTSNGSITATGVGGTAPYSFSIDGINFQASGNFNGLAAGNYTISIKDGNNCINTTTVIIGNTNGATVSATSTNSSCGTSNGSIAATGTGGTAPYSFSIDGTNFQASGNFNGLAAGSYTVSIKDGNNCINTTTVIIGNTNGATVSATSTNSSCGSSNGSITATGTGGTAPYSFSIDGINFQASGNFNGLAGGSYTVSIKDANNCVNTISIVVGNTSGATVAATSTNASCGTSNGSITATGTGGTAPYSFSIDGINFQASGNFNGLTAGSYTVSIKDANNCINTISIAVGNSNGATVAATSTNASCGSSNGSITATGTGGTAPYSFSIDGINFQASGNFNGLAAGSYTVSIKDANNCVNTTTVIIGNTNGATVSATSTNSSCGSSNGSIAATGTGGTAPYSFSIDGINFQASGSFTGLAAGSYIITIKDANGCQNTASATITNVSGATVTAIATPAFCGNSTGTLTATGSGGTAPFMYSIDGINFQANNQFSALAAGNYTLSIKDANQCISSVAVTITAITGPLLSASGTTATCGNPNASITATATGGTAPYEYSINGINYQSGTLFSGLSAGTYNISVRDANHCISVTSVIITEAPGATITANGTGTTCGNANGTILAIGSGGTQPYQFSINGSAYQSSGSFSGLAAGTYIVQIKDGNNCLSTTSITLQDTPAAIPAAISTASTCGLPDGTITASATGGRSPYQFALNNGVFQSDPLFSNLTPGTYTLTVKDGSGCSRSTTVTVPVFNPVTVNAGADASICQGSVHQLNGTSNGTRYSWSPATSLSNPAILKPLAAPTQTTQYILTAFIGTCAKSDTVLITVLPNPVADAGPDQIVCSGTPVSLLAKGGSTYRWQPAQWLSDANSPAPKVTVTTAGRYRFFVKTISADGCESEKADSVDITILPPLRVFAGRDTVAAVGQPIQLTAQDIQNAGFTSYSWSPATGLNNPRISNPVAILNNDITYRVIAKDRNGCEATDDIRIKVYQKADLYVPNAFTPNNDGKNDALHIIPVGIKELRYFRIFNRWGQLVFSSEKLSMAWDGTVNGQSQATGTFVWTAEAVDYNGKTIRKTGTVTLIH